MDRSDAPTSTSTPSPIPQPPRPSHNPSPLREDCWSENATFTLIEAWGDRYVELNRGILRQKRWQEVADAVNADHSANKKARRTDVQCKNRIDTLKKKYKIEKARILDSDGTLSSKWPFYYRLDSLIGSTAPAKKSPSPPPPPLALPLPYRQTPLSLPHALPVPLLVQSGKENRPSPAVDDSFFRRNFSAAAAAAAAAAADNVDDNDVDSGSSSSSMESWQREREREMNGFHMLAQAISRFGEIYEKVEGAKQRQMVELEKQRMQFSKDLEFQRMQLFMDTHVQLEKINRAKTKRTATSGSYL
ncbi:trihelix transcription factor ASIL1-like [Macadamia integrifolia]|uniref:trihelix transcription factor ASIL1-like n=1 Tax=Macadamia integrifolia TaxID=60698 RepID=UPI001C4F46FF|nr:trihelix transcription factor ASIL1-like [Macadamia integrifolia]